MFTPFGGFRLMSKKQNHRVDARALQVRRLLQFFRLCREQAVGATAAREALRRIGLQTEMVDEAHSLHEESERLRARLRAARAERGRDRTPDEKSASGGHEGFELKTLSDFTLALARQGEDDQALAREFGIDLAQPSRDRNNPGKSGPGQPVVPRPTSVGDSSGLRAVANGLLPEVSVISGATRESLAPAPGLDQLVRNERVRGLIQALPAAVTVVLVAWAAFHVPPRGTGTRTREALMAAPPPAAQAPNRPVIEATARPSGERGTATDTMRRRNPTGSGPGHRADGDAGRRTVAGSGAGESRY